MLVAPASLRACGSRNVPRCRRRRSGRRLVGPVLWVTTDATRGISACHRRRHLGLAGGALVVHRGHDAGVVDLPHARDRLVEVAAVVAGGDLDAGAVGAAPRVERRGRRLERVRLVLQREHGRLEHGHQPDLQRLRRVARAVVPQADGLVVDRAFVLTAATALPSVAPPPLSPHAATLASRPRGRQPMIW